MPQVSPLGEVCATSANLPAKWAVSCSERAYATSRERGSPDADSEDRKSSSCSVVKRRCPPGVRYPRRWPLSDHRRTVERDTPKWRAASDVERPRREEARL